MTHFPYFSSDWSIPLFGSKYPNMEISSRQRFFLNNLTVVKKMPNGLLCLDTLIQTLEILLVFRKAKNTRLATRVFSPAFRKFFPRVWISVSKHRKPLFRDFFNCYIYSDLWHPAWKLCLWQSSKIIYVQYVVLFTVFEVYSYLLRRLFENRKLLGNLVYFCVFLGCLWPWLI